MKIINYNNKEYTFFSDTISIILNKWQILSNGELTGTDNGFVSDKYISKELYLNGDVKYFYQNLKGNELKCTELN